MPSLKSQITAIERPAIEQALTMLRKGKTVTEVGAFIDAEQAKLNDLRAGGSPVPTATETVLDPVEANWAEQTRERGAA